MRGLAAEMWRWTGRLANRADATAAKRRAVAPIALGTRAAVSRSPARGCTDRTAYRSAIATEAGCDAVGLDGAPLRYDLASGLLRPGFVVTAPGGGREACVRAVAAAGPAPTAPGADRT